MQSKRLVILDRDGVINEDSDEFIKSAEEWQAIPGSLEAITKLGKAGFVVVVITNQSGIARGLLTYNTLNQIHQKMLDQLHALGGEINAIFFCPHGPDENCSCRKPLPGLYKELQERLNYKLDNVDSVGDSLRDIQAAHAAGARPVLVRTGKGVETESTLGDPEHAGQLGEIPVYDDLASYVESLRKQGKLQVAG